MRTYLGKRSINCYEGMTTGEIGEKVFFDWFNNCFQGDVIHHQRLDRDFQGIDFACDKGWTYQVKATKGKTFTFNSDIEELPSHLRSDWYVFIQIKDNYAYIEGLYDKEDILKRAKNSFKYDNCFVWAKDLLQETLF